MSIDDDHQRSESTSAASGSGWMLVGGAAVAVVLLVVVGAFAWALSSGGGPTTHTFVVAAGTGAQLDAGTTVELMPTEVRLAVGDTLVIRNDDDRDYVVGPYLVRSGETIEQTYRRAQTLVGECALSGTGEIRIIVT